MQIEHNDLATGTQVWYKHEKTHYNPYGPFTVTKFYSNHEGRHVLLKATGLGERAVLLADDDDFGSPIFYDSDPAT
jgi:hypothetical protein